LSKYGRVLSLKVDYISNEDAIQNVAQVVYHTKD